MPKFIVKQGTGVGSEIPIERTEMLFGRTEECDVMIADANVSRRHAQVVVLDGLTALVDLGSSNGTLVNGLPISRIFLMDGDEVTLGGTVLVYAAGSGEEAGEISRTGSRVSPLPPAAGGAPQKPGTADGDLIGRTQLFASVPDETHSEAFKEVYQKLKALYRVLHEVMHATNLKEVFEAVGRAVTLSTAAERVVFFLNAEKSGGSWQRYYVHTPAGSDDRVRRHGECAPLLDRVRDSASLVLGRTDAGGRCQPAEGTGDTAVIPLLRSGRLMGALYADSPQSNRTLEKNDLDFLVTVGLQIGARLGQIEQVQQLKQENVRLRQTIDEDFAVVVQNERMKQIMTVTERVAASEASVLVTGESGTGKELIAKSIHRFSRRGGKPLIAVNCAALPETLLESELFGHEKGAFTGALERRIGKFEQADGGTLFLDEIGDISAAAQAKLLRALQEGEITRVGGNNVIKVDVRLIAATNKNLAEEVAGGRFRQDLFFRLKVIEILLPPLRERPDDIPALAEYFFKQLRQKTPTPVKRIAPETMRLLVRYPFPGNVRELRNVIERGLVFAFGEEMLPEHLPMELLQPLPGAAPGIGGASVGVHPPASDLSMAEENGSPLSLAELEKRHIQHVLRFTKGNKLKTAALLGISRTTLYEKLKIYELESGGSGNHDES